MELQNFDTCFAGIQSCFGPIFAHYAHIPPFWIGMYSLCHCMLEADNWLVFLFFMGDGRVVTLKEIALNLNADSTVLRLLKTTGTFEVGLNAFFIIRWS